MRSLTSLLGLALILPDLAATSPTTHASAAAAQATVKAPAGTVIGSVTDKVEYFRGIHYAQPPVGPLRLHAPVRASPAGTISATGVGPTCPQMTNQLSNFLIEEVAAIPVVRESLAILTSTSNVQEDCLTISVMRPAGTAPDAKLPILFWMFGGGFEIGTPNTYNGSVLVPQSVRQGTPMIFVTVNYRLGGFGFLPGKEVRDKGLGNLGLLDQRMGLEWIADNIAAFGGDSDKVTIWGQSAGSFSVFDQMILFDGNATYKKKPLFRAGIMNSGSLLPSEPIDAPRAQAIFDTVVENAGCASTAGPHKIECLRNLDYDTYVNATNSVPSPFSYHSPVSSFTVRPDGKTITASPEVLARKGVYAHIPVITGIQEDEGTFLSLTQTNLTTHSDLVTFLHENVFQNASLPELEAFVATYPFHNGSAGAPFGTGTANRAYPQFKRLSAILGDITFIMMRRALLDMLPSSMKAWSYISTYGHGTPYMGTFHTMDLPLLFYGNDNVSRSLQSRYIAFVDSLDPNHGLSASPAGFKTEWPLWKKDKELLEFGANSTNIASDNFRSRSYEFIKEHLTTLRI